MKNDVKRKMMIEVSRPVVRKSLSTITNKKIVIERAWRKERTANRESNPKIKMMSPMRSKGFEKAAAHNQTPRAYSMPFAVGGHL
jgi:hypothetical protein